jgi:hypothetical protein
LEGTWDFRFFTVWNYTALVVLFVLLAAHSSAGAAGQPLPKHLRRCTWVLFEVQMCNAFVVDTTMWLVLFPIAEGGVKRSLLTWTSINTHGTNAAMMLVELLLGGMVVLPVHGLFMLAGLCWCVKVSVDGISPLVCARVGRFIPDGGRVHLT